MGWAVGKNTGKGFAIVLFTLSLTTCDLFNPGLGSKVDINPPQITISSPAGGTVVGGSFTIAGTASDDLSLASVGARWGNASTAPANLSQGAWTVLIPAANGLADGANDFILTATDGSGKTSEARVSIVLDNTPPTVLLSVPTDYGAGTVRSAYLDVEGQVDDASILSEIALFLFDAAGTQVGVKTLRPVRSWSGSIRFADATEVPAPIADKTSYRYFIRVTDAAGNVNSSMYHAADLWPSIPSGTAFPKIEDWGKLDRGETPTLASLTVAGLHALRRGASAGLSLPDFKIDMDPPSVSVETPAADSWVSGATTIALGTASKDSVKIYVWLGPLGASAPADIAQWSVAAGSAASWNALLPLSGSTEGTYELHAKSVDINGSQSPVQKRGFVIDQGTPVVDATLTLPAGSSGGYSSGAFTMAVNVTDTNAVASFSITESKNRGTPVAVPVNPAKTDGQH